MFRPDSKVLMAVLGLAMGACLVVAPASAALIDLTPAAGQPNSATSVSLAALISAQDGITVGDKNFTAFGYIGGGDMPTAANVQVAGLRDADGNWGLTFQGAFLDLPGGANSDAAIRFTVEIAAAQIAQGWRITDAHLAIHGAGVAGDNSLFLVDETLSNGQTLEAYVTTLGPGTTPLSKLTDVKNFAHVTKLNVVKDILAIAAQGTSLPSRGTVIDQSFSQEIIPEPASVALFGMSGLALIGFGRRRG